MQSVAENELLLTQLMFELSDGVGVEQIGLIELLKWIVCAAEPAMFAQTPNRCSLLDRVAPENVLLLDLSLSQDIELKPGRQVQNCLSL